ncbi:MAG: ferritin family protein [Sedimentisphaerales bacterium]|nr:ferritin family protein [Sedimentisphaerales bacterium]
MIANKILCSTLNLLAFGIASMLIRRRFIYRIRTFSVVWGNERKNMGMVESDQEILEFAIFRENEAYNFFMTLADSVKDDRISKVFEDLAAEELEHKAKLELEVMKMGKTVSTELEPPRPANEYIISDDPSPLDMDYKDVLMLAIEKEDAAYRTYINLIGTIHDEHSREVLLALAQEEIKHKMRFETEYKLLQKKQDEQ